MGQNNSLLRLFHRIYTKFEPAGACIQCVDFVEFQGSLRYL
jgi:hypothetical protein